MTSERIDQLDAPAEVFYRRLMSKVDDFGLSDARPSILRSSLYPLRVDRVREADITRWIAACEKAGVIALYVHDGKPYLQMVDTGWQTRSEPKCPLPPWGKGKPHLATANSCAQLQTPAPVFVFGDGVEDGKARKRAESLRLDVLVADGLTEQTAEEWLAHRKRKGSALTARAWEGIKAEAKKAGWALERAVCKALHRGWQSFEADWVKAESPTGDDIFAGAR